MSGSDSGSKNKKQGDKGRAKKLWNKGGPNRTVTPIQQSAGLETVYYNLSAQ